MLTPNARRVDRARTRKQAFSVWVADRTFSKRRVSRLVLKFVREDRNSTIRRRPAVEVDPCFQVWSLS